MKRMGAVAALVVLLVLGFSTSESGSPTPAPLPLDPPAAFKTRLPRISGMVGLGKITSPNWAGNTVTLTTTFPEAEEFIALYPANPNNSVAVISDFSLRAGSNTTKYAVSFNNGAAGTWFENFVPLVNQRPATSDGRTWEFNSNPVVAIDKQGYVYVSSLYFNMSDLANGIYACVGRLTTPNLGFSSQTAVPVVTNLSPTSTFNEDKPWLAVDNSDAPSSGNVYVSWTRFSETPNGERSTILFTRSVDHGAAWSAPIRISEPQQDGAVQGSQVAVGPNGEVYVVYEVFYQGNKRQQFLARSTDAGQTFGLSVAITPVFNELTFPSTYRKNSFASIAVSPTNGHVYVVYADEPSAGTGSEVEFIESRDGGATFSPPAPVNKPAQGHQFMPALTVDNAGVIHVSWYDTRNSSQGTSAYDIYATSCANDRGAFAPNKRVTAATIDAGTASFIGDYGGIAASSGFAHPVWTSGGFNNGMLQTATLQ
jgi:hypothetical protein